MSRLDPMAHGHDEMRLSRVCRSIMNLSGLQQGGPSAHRILFNSFDLSPQPIGARCGQPAPLSGWTFVPVAALVATGDLQARRMSVSIFLVRAVVEAVERSGAAHGDWRARIPLNWERLEQPDARLDFVAFEQILSAAVDVTGDEALGLHLAEQVTESAIDLLAHLSAHSPTMRLALEVNARLIRLLTDEMRLTLRDEGDLFFVHYTIPRSTGVSERLLAELLMGGAVRLARFFAGPCAGPRHVGFEHQRPDHHREYTRIFGDEPRFDQGVTSIAFDREIADHRQIHQHPELYELLRAEAERRLHRITTGVRPAARLREYLFRTSPSRIPDMYHAARELGMSERSLRRQLAADGTSYRDLVRSALEASAGHMLDDPRRTVKETAAALGFAEVAAFNRAFKRWTGMTPGEYRRAREHA
jgi:AraC-like DNA-binding protein